MQFRDSLRQSPDAERGAAAAPVSQRLESFECVEIDGDQVRNSNSREGGPAAGARATVETSAQIEIRADATPLMMRGWATFVARKRRGESELFLTVEGDGFALVVEVAPALELQARRFAATLNAASSHASG
jgi:hypothetical protein